MACTTPVHQRNPCFHSYVRTRIPPIGFETLEPETSSDDDYDYNYDYDVSDIEHWLASDGHDVDMA